MGLFDRFKNNNKNMGQSIEKPNTKQLMKIIKNNESNLEGQLNALEGINEDKYLMKIIKDRSINVEVRIKSVEKINDWKKLIKIATNPTDGGLFSSDFNRVRDACVERIEDDKILLKIIKLDCESRYAAVKTIHDENILIDIVNNDRLGRWALSNPNLKNKELLRKKAYESLDNISFVFSNPNFNDEREIGKILCFYYKDYRSFSQMQRNTFVHLLIYHIEDEQIVADVLKEFPNYNVLPDSMGKVIAKINNEEILGDICINAKNDRMKSTCLYEIKNEKILFDVFSNIYSPSNRDYIIKNVNDEDLLKEMLKIDAVSENRVKLCDKLNINYLNTDDEEILADLAISSDDKIQAGKALSKIEDQGILYNIAMDLDCDLDTFKKAVRKLNNVNRIKLALNYLHSDNDQLRFVINRINDQDALINIANNAENSLARKLAVDKVDDDSVREEYRNTRNEELEIQLQNEKEKMPLLDKILRSSSHNLLKYNWEDLGKDAESNGCYLLALKAYEVQDRVYASYDDYMTKSHSSKIKRNDDNIDRIKSKIGYD